MKKKTVIKKKLEHFLKDETGYISKEAILKIGLGTVSTLGILGAFSSTLAVTHADHNQHANAIGGVPAGLCMKIDHSSHASHADHASY